MHFLPASHRRLALAASLAVAGPLFAQSPIYRIDPVDSAGFGGSAQLLPDVNADGFADFFIGDYLNDTFDEDAGSVTIYSGHDGLEIASIYGLRAGDWFGFAATVLDDLTGDGVSEFAVGAPAIFEVAGGGQSSERGYVRIYNGATGQVLRHISAGADCEQFGFSVANIGDVDGDGVSDVAIGAPTEGIGGRIYVYSPVDGSLIWSAPNDAAGARFGSSIALVGDLDLDGVDDFAIGAPGQPVHGPNSGAVFVISAATLTLVATLEGDGPGEHFGRSVAAAGDLNLDGVDDLLVGSPFGDDIFPTGFPQTPGFVRGFSGNGGTQLFKMNGQHAGDLFGWSVASLGDLDGDGASDFVAGAPRAGSANDSGSVTGFSGLDQTELFLLEGDTGERLGRSLDAGEDVNADGFPDAVAGAGAAVVFSSVRLGLVAIPHYVSASQGGFVDFDVDTGPENAGQAYYILGSMGGTSPGIPFGPFVIPLNWDQYFCETLVYPNTGPFEWNLGGLNSQGQATAPTGLMWGPGLEVFTGVQAHHVVVAWNPAFGTVSYVSAPTSLTFLP